jgi:D-glycerate 3-kinase
MQADPRIVALLEEAVRSRLNAVARRPLVLGLCGAQGSGKSTIAAALAKRLADDGIPTAVLSLDDIYKTKADRRVLARDVHPLFATRGVPGTHDVALARSVVEALTQGAPALLPRFDKAIDDRSPPGGWSMAAADTQVLILEGWFVGARPQSQADLAAPINTLEQDEDRDGVWRRYANRALGGDYQQLFARIDLTVFLAAPDFTVVEGWRRQQEHALRAERRGGMSDSELGRFVQHYERLTQHILSDMPNYADITISLNVDRTVRAIDVR